MPASQLVMRATVCDAAAFVTRVVDRPSRLIAHTRSLSLSLCYVDGSR